MQKEPISSRLDWTSLVDKRFINIWLKRKLFSQENTSGQDALDWPIRTKDLLHLDRSWIQPYKKLHCLLIKDCSIKVVVCLCVCHVWFRYIKTSQVLSATIYFWARKGKIEEFKKTFRVRTLFTPIIPPQRLFHSHFSRNPCRAKSRQYFLLFCAATILPVLMWY